MSDSQVVKEEPRVNEIEVFVENLADEFHQHPIFLEYIQAVENVQRDDQAKRFHSEVEALQTKMRMNGDETLRVQLAELAEQYYGLPSLIKYQEAETLLRALLVEVDDVISSAAGVAFAANAQRSCCGG